MLPLHRLLRRSSLLRRPPELSSVRGPPLHSASASSRVPEFMASCLDNVCERLSGLERRQEELVGKVDGLGLQLFEIISILKPSTQPPGPGPSSSS
ncbi:uncharacterized protein A4U43_C04F11080 [Asparagus officinalis]|uniref:Uncharacterized protein n=1 Tax=Asparagus officinalis TaxID=4686 RepID=A0A5P1F0N6_ASPOF|nr:uncharacterized protein A4U43_C04F11080 [Asparagus officinalis]